jgi:hypothetical protein
MGQPTVVIPLCAFRGPTPWPVTLRCITPPPPFPPPSSAPNHQRAYLPAQRTIIGTDRPEAAVLDQGKPAGRNSIVQGHLHQRVGDEPTGPASPGSADIAGPAGPVRANLIQLTRTPASAGVLVIRISFNRIFLSDRSVMGHLATAYYRPDSAQPVQRGNRHEGQQAPSSRNRQE